MYFQVSVNMFSRIVRSLSGSQPLFNCVRAHVSVSHKTVSYSTSTFLKMSEEGSKIHVNGVNINYVRVGDGPHSVLCLPGALGSVWTDFKPQIDLLDHKLFTVVAWDPPGYGYSRPPDRDFSPGFFQRDADMAVKLMMALKIPKFSLLGWSDGGITAIILAAKYPQHVKKCAVWGANAYIVKEEIEMYQKIRNIDSWSERMRAPLLKLYGEEYFRKTWEAWVDAFLHIYNYEEGKICVKEAKLVQCPLFVLHGAKDPMVAEEHPTFLTSSVPNSRLHVFQDGKHNIHLKYPEEFNKLVTDFLTQHSPGAFI